MSKLFAAICMLFTFLLFAQNRSFVYELVQKPNPAKDSTAKALFILDINDHRSVFRSAEEKHGDSIFITDKSMSFMTTSQNDYLTAVKDVKKKETSKYITSFNKIFSLKIEETLNWKIENETKNFLTFKVQKATTTYGGRNWVAWFAPEIPLPEGPYIFYGLPGLITEIHDSKNDYHFSLLQIRSSEGKLYQREGVLPISWKQYRKLALDYYANPTLEISGKNSGSNPMFIVRWYDESGTPYTPNFQEMNLREQRRIRENNNPVELNQKLNYK